MAEFLHQLRLVVYPIIYKVYTFQVVVWDFWNHQQYDHDGSQVSPEKHGFRVAYHWKIHLNLMVFIQRKMVISLHLAALLASGHHQHHHQLDGMSHGMALWIQPSSDMTEMMQIGRVFTKTTFK